MTDKISIPVRLPPNTLERLQADANELFRLGLQDSGSVDMAVLSVFSAAFLAGYTAGRGHAEEPAPAEPGPLTPEMLGTLIARAKFGGKGKVAAAHDDGVDDLADLIQQELDWS